MSSALGPSDAATSDLPSLLLASLSPATRKQAEHSLNTISAQPGFLSLLLQLVLDPSQDRSVRLAGSVFFKNVARKSWDEDQEGFAIHNNEKLQLRMQLVPALISLSGPTDKAIRAQMAETVSIIAEFDFPAKWDDLIDQLVASLSPRPSSYATNVSILETAHSIFRRWRSDTRSDSLYTVINYVLSRFMEPFLQLFRHTATTLLSDTLHPEVQSVAQAQVVLLNLFYDLTCQDLPPAIEDANEEFFGAQDGWFMKFLAWEPEVLKGDADDTTPSLPTQIKTAIFEIAELYTHRFPEQLASSSSVQAFTQALWSILGGGQKSGVAYDGLVAQALRFLSAAIRSGSYKEIFQTKQTISGLIEGVVVPNVGLREHEIEQFEDDPLEYIRLDLSLSSSSSGLGGLTAEGTTRRQAAAEVLRSLVSSGFEEDTTEVTGNWIGKGLQEYSQNTGNGDRWKSKDVAIYLLGAVASKGGTTQHGVTSTNSRVDVIQFFSEHVFQDLQAEPGTVHPILQVDAIRFLYTFRAKLTKDQLISVLPLLVRHLSSANYVTYTYAAITIERILFLKQGSQSLFDQGDIREISPSVLDAVLTKIENGRTPEKIAENDYLMRCAMRVIFTARQTLSPIYEQILRRLVVILAAICKNPSNPNFDQYIFESISGLIRFTVAGAPQTLTQFEEALFYQFTQILQQDIDQFSPYVFQILAQMLELHQGEIPLTYRTLLPFLLQPASWQQKGSIPGLVRLLKGFLRRDTAQLVSTGQFTSVLAVVQQRLIPSKLNDSWGFELLQSVVQNIPPSAMTQYMKSVITMLLTRLQTSKTDSYTYSLVYFFMFTMAINVNNLTPDFLIGAVEEVQPQLWSQLLGNIVLPHIPKFLPKDRKVVIVGLTRMLTESRIMLTEPAMSTWPTSLTALVKLFSDTLDLTSAQRTEAQDPDELLRSIDFEEQGAGYQAAYSKLAASETIVEDPVASVGDSKEFVARQLGAAVGKDARIRGLVGMADAEIVGPFMQSLSGGV